MARPTPTKVSIQSPIRDLRVERDIIAYRWRIWITANGDFTCGTFIELLDDGTIQRVTWHNDGTESYYGDETTTD